MSFYKTILEKRRSQEYRQAVLKSCLLEYYRGLTCTFKGHCKKHLTNGANLWCPVDSIMDTIYFALYDNPQVDYNLEDIRNIMRGTQKFEVIGHSAEDAQQAKMFLDFCADYVVLPFQALGNALSKDEVYDVLVTIVDVAKHYESEAYKAEADL